MVFDKYNRFVNQLFYTIGLKSSLNSCKDTQKNSVKYRILVEKVTIPFFEQVKPKTYSWANIAQDFSEMLGKQ